jgi:hypothetical protein
MTRAGDRFERQRSLPISWYNKAADFRTAAGAVWVAIQDEKPDPRLGFADGFRMSAACPLVYRLLCGQALELCLKAVVVANGEEPEQTHQLDKLSHRAGVIYDERGMGLLRVLSDAIVWLGRYPIPTGSDSKARKKCSLATSKIDESLFDRKPLGTFAVLSPNHALDWVGFSQLGDVASQEYWLHHRDE